MRLTVYHNPRCSKSRNTLNLIESHGVSPSVVRYLDQPPSAATIESLADAIGVAVRDLVRRNEAVFKEATDSPDLSDNGATARWLAAHPQALQRPLVIDEDSGRAVIGRPPENVLSLLDGSD